LTGTLGEHFEAGNSGSVDAFDSEAQAHGFEDGGEAAELGVALLGEGAVELGWVEVGFFGHGLYAPEGVGHLAQGNEELTLFAVFENAVHELNREGGVSSEDLRDGFVVGYVPHVCVLSEKILQIPPAVDDSHDFDVIDVFLVAIRVSLIKEEVRSFNEDTG